MVSHNIINEKEIAQERQLLNSMGLKIIKLLLSPLLTESHKRKMLRNSRRILI